MRNLLRFHTCFAWVVIRMRSKKPLKILVCIFLRPMKNYKFSCVMHLLGQKWDISTLVFSSSHQKVLQKYFLVSLFCISKKYFNKKNFDISCKAFKNMLFYRYFCTRAWKSAHKFVCNFWHRMHRMNFVCTNFDTLFLHCTKKYA